jgi:dihydrofolate reductase
MTTRAQNPTTTTPKRAGGGRAGLTGADLRRSARPPRPIHRPKSPQIPSKASPATLDFHRSSEAELFPIALKSSDGRSFAAGPWVSTDMTDRKVVLKMVMSLDGFATSPDGTHDWMFEWFGDDSGEWNLRALEEAGVHAMGRRSYEIMGPHWAASEGPIATAMNEKPKAVFSRTLEKATWGPAEIFGGDLGAAIGELKARDDEGTILVHGGPDFAKSLTRLGLVDEYQLTTVPIAIGAGHSPFADLREHLKLDVVEEERFQSGALAQILVPKP